jgi:putative spermidine/putrescine transport system substrate-binding protein
LRYTPTNKLAELPADVAAEVVYGEDAVAKLVSFDANKIAADRAAWNEAWTRAIAQ